eukprot:CAMPEP_0183341036 /NCGR_PEP_ID=MMETSP0164_2-20130417/7384_1 /TAXON_ID=221442 /ORGANISM="Coccolithus pelagicus ssp braarudi, Strain PLY182g" /LENGTH=62 /DNA_ID=CAMNT_0025511267 /DNA_START=485 /DNA_END=673 /DNA_ORIENTATION=+
MGSDYGDRHRHNSQPPDACLLRNMRSPLSRITAAECLPGPESCHHRQAEPPLPLAAHHHLAV